MKKPVSNQIRVVTFHDAVLAFAAYAAAIALAAIIALGQNIMTRKNVSEKLIKMKISIQNFFKT
jgi:hypothetical protein